MYTDCDVHYNNGAKRRINRRHPTYNNDESQSSNKVAQLIDEYGLSASFGEQLESLWMADAEERENLRSLAGIFNQRLLTSAVGEAAATTLYGEIKNLYRLLTDDNVSSGQRTKVWSRLRQGEIKYNVELQVNDNEGRRNTTSVDVVDIGNVEL